MVNKDLPSPLRVVTLPQGRMYPLKSRQHPGLRLVELRITAVPVSGGDHEWALVKTIGTKDVHESIDGTVGVEQLVAIVDDRAVAGARNPQVVPAIGLKEIAELFQKRFGVLERHLRSSLVPAAVVAAAACRDQYVEKPQRFRQALDELDHQVDMPAGRTDAEPLLTIGEPLPLEHVVIPMWFALFRSGAKFHTCLRFLRRPASRCRFTEPPCAVIAFVNQSPLRLSKPT